MTNLRNYLRAIRRWLTMFPRYPGTPSIKIVISDADRPMVAQVLQDAIEANKRLGDVVWRRRG